jgi:alpha-L-arabinofuranosidase
LFKTPTYYVQELYANNAGQTPLTVQIDAEVPSDPALDTSATLSADGSVLTIFIVNRTGAAQSRNLDLTAVGPLAESVEVSTVVDTLHAGQRDAANSWREPDRIRTQSAKINSKDSQVPYQFPPLSLTLLKFQTQSTTRPAP